MTFLQKIGTRARADAPLSVGYFPALTGFRALAAFLVYFHHFGGAPPTSWIFPIFHEGHVGVTFFFVLSGFLIAWRYGAKPKLSEFDIRNYLLNRIARIWPLYFILTIITLVHQRSTDLSVWIGNLTFLRGFSDAIKFSGVAQGWSLTVEETFYLSAPFIFAVTPWLATRFGRAHLPRAAAFVVQPALWFLAGLGLVKLMNWLTPIPLAFHTVKFTTLYTFFGRSFEFYCGYFAACRYRERTSGSRSTFGILTWTSFVAAFALVRAFQYLRTDAYFYGLFHPLGVVINNVCLPPVIAVLVYGLATERTLIGRILSFPVVELLGKASYAFYLVHHGVVMALTHALFPSMSFWARFALINLIAVAVFKAVEEPLNRAVKARFGRRRVAVPIAAPAAQPSSVP